jgi:acetyl-CoA carboxylase biotin carboxylase subunit
VIRKVLIANRGEVAVRIIIACRELGLRTVAIYSEADVHSRHVEMADEDVCVGPPPATQSYLNIEAVLRATRHTGADAIHPGYGFLSENAIFAEACARAGVVFVGPPARAIAQMGSKIDARRLVESAGVPVVPGETPRDQSDAGIRRAVESVGTPALIKASAGGGGKGMRVVRADADAVDAAQAARREAAAAFNDGTLYVEKLIEAPHHVEVQVFGDDRGGIVHLFERECSVQRRHQKIIEESPSPAISADLRARITDAAVAAARAASYRNAGTIEFLVDVRSGAFYFLEMNTRLQVEHPVTEEITGIDLVRAQLLAAAGAPLPWRQQDIVQRGHAIEARVYAENPAAGFLPQAGPLALYREPRMPGVRVDSGVREGDVIGVHYDPLIAKVIARAETRELAISRLQSALRNFPVLGIATNISFLLRVLAHPRFHAGEIDTGFLDGPGADLAALAAVETSEVPAAVLAAVAAHDSMGTATPGDRGGIDPWGGLDGWRT